MRGSGVYVTDLAWGTDGQTLESYITNGSKHQRCIALNISANELESCKAHVWVFRGSVPWHRTLIARHSDEHPVLNLSNLPSHHF